MEHVYFNFTPSIIIWQQIVLQIMILSALENVFAWCTRY